MKKRAIAGWVIFVLASAGASAQTETKRPEPEGYAGTTANMTSGAGNKIEIQVFRWSSETDRERALLSLSAEKNPEELTKAIAGLPTVGRIWGAGPLGYTLKYAHRVAQADGSERVHDRSPARQSGTSGVESSRSNRARQTLHSHRTASEQQGKGRRQDVIDDTGDGGRADEDDRLSQLRHGIGLADRCAATAKVIERHSALSVSPTAP
jgi:hypothetical protein